MIKGRPASFSVTRPDVSRDPDADAASTGEQRSTFLRFITADGREFGFPYAQLLEFVLDSNSSSDAPQRLLLAFPSHDVTVTGFRLHLLCDQLDQHEGMKLKVEDSRFANLHLDKPFVCAISVATVPPD
jgi:hypothetical protein